MLLIADLHLGKSAHFRKAGIALPAAAETANLTALNGLLEQWQPSRLVFLGDLFHSDLNTAWNDFCTLRHFYADVSFELVLGNHDILPVNLYAEAGLTVHREVLLLQPFRLLHQLPDEEMKGYYDLAGHVHPCILLAGSGRQKLRLPCFHLAERQGLLPAFGTFTGMHPVETKPEDRVYAIAAGKIIAV